MTELRTPEPARVVRMRVGDEVLEASYTPPELRLMERNRAAGATDEEQRLLHAVKAHFGVDLVVDTDEYADGGKRARAVGSGSQWDDRRNTSNRAGHRVGVTQAELERQQRDAERQAEEDRARAERERQGELFTEAGGEGAA